jgi:hypothetical protein
MIQDAAQHWRNVANEAPVQALARVEEAAKQLIGLTAALQGLYFAVFAFSDLRKQLGSMNVLVPGSLILLLFFIPIVLWLISLYCATRVFVPQVRPGVNLNDVSVGAWQQIKDAYEATVDQKLKWLRRSHVTLVVSFAAVLLMLVLLALLPAPPAAGPTPIIIVTPTSVGTPMPTP